jgi:hypothetical protein
MTYKVWQQVNPTFMDGSAAVVAADAFPTGFQHVATVTGDHDIFDCFELTNSIHDAWWNNADVAKVVDGGCRSTSVGDVIEAEDGRAFMVLGIGWEQIRDIKGASND